MKKIVVLLFTTFSMLLNAGVIVKTSGDKIENVTIKSVTNAEIVYVAANGEETSILKSDVQAILYDDGRYEEIRQSNTSTDKSFHSTVSLGEDVTEINVLAFGKSMMKFYVTDHTFDGATVEYRVIYKGQKNESEWAYLGTTPFAYTTTTGRKDPFINKDLESLAEIRPLSIDNFKNVKKVEFRLSKEGYKTIVVSPVISVSVTGLYYCISLNKLKPIKDVDKNNEISESTITRSENSTIEQVSVMEGTLRGNEVSEEQFVNPTASMYNDGQIHKLSFNQFYFEDSLYSKKEIQSLVIMTCPSAEQYYKNAKKWVIGGWCGVGVGLAMTIIGGALLGVGTELSQSYHSGNYYGYYYNRWDYGAPSSEDHSSEALLTSGYVLLPIGCAAIAASLPIACIGHYRINNIYTVYNESCTRQKNSDIALCWSFTGSGIGMKLCF